MTGKYTYDYGYQTPAKPGGQTSYKGNTALTYSLIFGESVRSNPVPEHTVLPAASPFIAFQSPQTGKRFGLSKTLLSHSMLLIGSPGGGKTNVMNMILLRLLLTQESSDVILIFDTKGDYIRTFGQIGGRNVIVVGNEEQYEDRTSFWNIFAEIMNRDADGRLRYTWRCDLTAKEIAKALFEGKESSQQPFFHLAASDLTAKIIIHLMREAERTGDQSRLNNAYLGHFLKSAGKNEILAILNDPHNPDFAGAKDYISSGERTTAQSQSVLAYIRAMANDLLIGVFGDNCPQTFAAGRQFSMNEIIRSRQKTVIFIEYDLSIGEALAPVYKLLFDLALKRSLGRREEEKTNVYLLLDELALMPKLHHLGNALSYGRSLGVKILAGIQNVSQIYNRYGKDGGDVILADFMNTICFYLSDEVSRTYMRERYGQNYQNLSFPAQNTSVNVQRNGYCAEEWDLLGLSRGQAVVKLIGESPFLFEFPKFGMK